MSLRQESAERTRRCMIDAGLRLAETTGLTGLSVNQIVREADVSKGSFFHHFGDRTNYLLALHREFHDRLLVDILEAIEGIDPGAARLRTGSTAYLDGCLENRGVRALLLEARAQRAIAEEVTERNTKSALLCEPDFAAMGWPQPLESARLWIAMAAEAALIEFGVGGRSVPTREALSGFLS